MEKIFKSKRNTFSYSWYLPRIFLTVIFGFINFFALSLCFHPHVSKNYRDFYISHKITLGEYEANEIRGVYTTHQNLWKY